MSIDINTPTADAAKRRPNILALAQLVFGIGNGLAAAKSVTQFRNADLASLIDAEREGIFSYKACIVEGDNGLQWPKSDAVMEALAAARNDLADESIMTELGLDVSLFPQVFPQADGAAPQQGQAPQQQEQQVQQQQVQPPPQAQQQAAAAPNYDELLGKRFPSIIRHVGDWDVPALQSLLQVEKAGRNRAKLVEGLEALIGDAAQVPQQVQQQQQQQQVPEDEVIIPHTEHPSPQVQQQPVQQVQVGIDGEALAGALEELEGRLTEAMQGQVEELRSMFGDLHDLNTTARSTLARGFVSLYGMQEIVLEQIATLMMFVDEHAEPAEVPDDIKNDMRAVANLIGDAGADEAAPAENTEPSPVQVAAHQAQLVQQPADPKPEAPRQQVQQPAASGSADVEIPDEITADWLRTLSLQELQRVADHVGVPDPYAHMYEKGLIRKILRQAAALNQ